jgi:hypothetical protein
MRKKTDENRGKTGILQHVSSLSLLDDQSTTFNYVKSIHIDIKVIDSNQEYPYIGNVLIN